ncbi:hypothetical protein GCM10029976_091040 [Kribbella albertanoniae]|uniref:hypothetical protein n=1 Tax=Kribbella albertanoniae TaxID=1266829 RepID=UPI0014050B26|nr:hypothetical protein [Kribbella albertanoniae]
MGVFETNPREEKDTAAPTADPTPTGGVVEVEGTEPSQTAGEQPQAEPEPDTTPAETDH